ncbi:MAG TPA: hypothetical protein VNJ04_08105 [Gemmatimonadaceae bacterium]|nr:hypothetical protein [Gemmatimonadaceae bacterium]
MRPTTNFGVTSCVTQAKEHRTSPKEVLMSQRQIRLVSGNSKPNSRTETAGIQLQSVRCEMLRVDSPTPSRTRDSPFLSLMRQLEATSPAHALVLLDLAKDILDERRRRVWSWPPLE